MKFGWIFIAIASGAFLPIQAGINTRLGKVIESPVYASLISFSVGVVAVALYGILTKEHFSWQGLKTAPTYLWTGGIFGGFYVTAIILAFPRIGPALTFGLVVAGQMIISVFLDHFYVLVTQQHPINTWRIIGIVLIVCGVVIIRKF